MGTVRFFPPDERLARAVSTPGGKLVSEAIAEAEASLQQVVDPTLLRIDETLARIHVVAVSGAVTDKEALYRDARDIAGLGAVCGLSELGEAALCLCTLLDLASAKLTAARLAVFDDVMRSLRNPDLFPSAGRAQILGTLRAMVDRASAA